MLNFFLKIYSAIVAHILTLRIVQISELNLLTQRTACASGILGVSMQGLCSCSSLSLFWLGMMALLF